MFRVIRDAIVESDDSMIKYILVGAALVVVLGAVLMAMNSSRVTAATLQPGQVPLDTILGDAAKGNVDQAWSRLIATGVRPAISGSSYQSLRTAESELRWMWPPSRSKLLAEAVAVVNQVRTFARTIGEDLGDDPDTEFSARYHALVELGDELTSADHLLIHQQVGPALKAEADRALAEWEAEAGAAMP